MQKGSRNASRWGCRSCCGIEDTYKRNPILKNPTSETTKMKTKLKTKNKTSIYPEDGWHEAAIAWAVCKSLHEQYCKGKDPFFKTRNKNFERHLANARSHIKPK
jgi:hypothetical protein